MLLLRKYTALLLTMLTLVISSRASVYGHFCGTQLQDLQLLTQAISCGMNQQAACDETDKIQAHSCCQDTHFQIKNQDLKTGAYSVAKAFSSPVLFCLQLLPGLLPAPVSNTKRFVQEPPSVPCPPLHILLGVFRI